MKTQTRARTIANAPCKKVAVTFTPDFEYGIGGPAERSKLLDRLVAARMEKTGSHAMLGCIDTGPWFSAVCLRVIRRMPMPTCLSATFLILFAKPGRFSKTRKLVRAGCAWRLSYSRSLVPSPALGERNIWIVIPESCPGSETGDREILTTEGGKWLDRAVQKP